MSYLRGSGTQADPYVIHDASAAQQFFSLTEPNFTSNAYFSVVADIDCSSFQLPNITSTKNALAWKSKLNGNGYLVSNIYVPGYYFCSLVDGTSAQIEFIALHFKRAGSFAYSNASTYRWYKLSNCVINCESGIFCFAAHHYTDAINVVTTDAKFGNGYTTPIGSLSTYICTPEALPSYTGFTGGIVLVGSDRFMPEKYPTLDRLKWIIDGVSLPRLIPNGRTDLTTKYAIKGSTKIAGVSKKRKVAVMTAAYLGLVKNTYTDDNGNYFFDMIDAYDPVYVMHYDDYGFPLAANTAYPLGSYIHPKTPNGYRYKCTAAGNSGASLPAEPWPTSSNLTAGTAIFSPEPVYASETFLVSPHLYDFLTGQPV